MMLLLRARCLPYRYVQAIQRLLKDEESCPRTAKFALHFLGRVVDMLHDVDATVSRLMEGVIEYLARYFFRGFHVDCLLF